MNLRPYKTLSVWSLSLLLVLFAAPQAAWACPACAMRDNGGIAAIVILAVMMILPFGLAGLVVYVLRKAVAEEANNVPAGDCDPAGGEQRA